MNKITLKSALFLMLFAIVFTSCEKEEDSDIPTITLSGDNPMVFDTINSIYNEPGASISEGTLHIDNKSLYMNKRGESAVYYSAIDDADNVGHATRKVIVKNPAEAVIGTYYVEEIDIATGVVVDLYIDEITQDDYHNGKFHLSNFNGPCAGYQSAYGKYDWNNNTVDIPSQSYNGQTISNNTGNAFGVNFNGSDITFQMEITTDGATTRYSYRKRNEPVDLTYIKSVHISPDAVAVDVRIDNNLVAEALAYTTSSSYITVDAGTRSYKINPVGTCTSIWDVRTWFDANKSYTMFMLDYQASLDVVRVEDDLSGVPSGEARVKFLNADPTIGMVDVLNNDNGALLFEDVNFKDNKTITLPQGTYSFKLTTPNTTDQIPGSTIGNIPLLAGKIYTVYCYAENAGAATFFKIVNNN